jgi:hypothetical protein
MAEHYAASVIGASLSISNFFEMLARAKLVAMGGAHLHSLARFPRSGTVPAEWDRKGTQIVRQHQHRASRPRIPFIHQPPLRDWSLIAAASPTCQSSARNRAFTLPENTPTNNCPESIHKQQVALHPYTMAENLSPIGIANVCITPSSTC